jgi:4-diphosphocytidyl-2-C-methyl-D-erythritol kinase
VSRPRDALANTRVVEARAKINLFLRVKGRRSDGYHDLESLVLPISLADRLEVHAASDPSFRTLSLALEVTGDPALARRVPVDESNLVIRAADALAREADVKGFADVLLEKRIPVAGGLGGGSADAAATLRALNELWGAPVSGERLGQIAAVVGSDVPALLAGGPALMRGRGERVDVVNVAPMRWTLVTFPFGISTREAYAWWDDDGGTGPDPEPLLQAAQKGEAAEVGRLMFNDLERPVLRRHLELQRTKESLLDAGAAGVVLCGSGSTMAALWRPDQELSIPDGIEVRS